MVEVLAPLEPHDVAQRTAKQRGAVAHAQAVAPVDGRRAAVNVPGVAKALANLRQLGVVLRTQRLHAFRDEVAQAVGAAQVHQFTSVVVELGQHLEGRGLSWAKSDVSLVDAELVELIFIPEVHQGVVVVGVLLVGPCVRRHAGHFVGQRAAAIVKSEPVGAAFVGPEHLLEGGLVVHTHRGAVVELELLGEVFGLHADVRTCPVAREVCGLGLHDDQVVHQVGGEEVHLDAVAARVHGRNLRAVERGLDVAVTEAANKHEVAHRAHAGHALDGSRGIAVAGLLDLLAGDEVHAGRALLLDVLHVHIARTVHLGHNLRSLLDDIRFDVQVEIEEHHLVADGHRFCDGRVADEASNHFVGARCQAFQAEVAIEVGHGPHVGVLDHHVGADEGLTGLGIGHFATDGSLSPCRAGDNRQGQN